MYISINWKKNTLSHMHFLGLLYDEDWRAYHHPTHVYLKKTIFCCVCFLICTVLQWFLILRA